MGILKIRESKTADTRTCDVSKVTKDTLIKSSLQHIEDVQKGMAFFIMMMKQAASKHDYTKLTGINQFFEDFKTGFKTQNWYEMHKTTERHHLSIRGVIPEDVNLIDVIEYIVDGAMAGMARSGKYRKEDISKDLLKRAFDNTIELLLSEIEIVEDQNV